jgi:hypothetical protein
MNQWMNEWILNIYFKFIIVYGFLENIQNHLQHIFEAIAIR